MTPVASPVGDAARTSRETRLRRWLANAQCPMTPVASSRETRPRRWLANAQYFRV
ncbi:hypothetical protein [Nostoc favosum]|uniref:Uncharacterized protein n=1 Tax=Nostoc favosum CHAB5714 TaxID=2780399 RepID=A0ABS8ID03_9NOSO|nr:hypothetical protein [Nostoc favosum]MCC5602090.1 hypothetical protein [Nostoc favosum CHAB5714]